MPFLVFEGLDGSGKSTLIKSLAKELKNRSIPFVLTREPGGTPLGEEVRKLLLSAKEQNTPTPWTELFLYEACRRQNVDQVILPALKQKKWVLCDRFWASSSAFQSGGRGLDESKVMQMNSWAVGDLHPDLWVFLDLPLKLAQERWENRTTSQPLDRFELEALSFHERVRNHYIKMAQNSQYGPWLTLQADQETKELTKKLIQVLQEKKWL